MSTYACESHTCDIEYTSSHYIGSPEIGPCWGNTHKDIWCVGNNAIYNWDGTSWSIALADLPEIYLSSMIAFSEDDVWLFGSSDILLEYESIQHWNGTEWTEMGSSIKTSILSSWGSAPNDVWALRHQNNADNPGTILHWNGSELLEEMASENDAVYKDIWGTARDNIWVMYHGETPSLLKYDGSGWETVNLDLQDIYYDGLWVTQEGDIWLTDNGIEEPSTVSHWDGAEWHHKKIKNIPLHSITGSTSDDIWAQGLSCKTVDETEECVAGLVRIENWKLCDYTKSYNPDEHPMFTGPIYRILWCNDRDVWMSNEEGSIIRIEL